MRLGNNLSTRRAGTGGPGRKSGPGSCIPTCLRGISNKKGKKGSGKEKKGMVNTGSAFQAANTGCKAFLISLHLRGQIFK